MERKVQSDYEAPSAEVIEVRHEDSICSPVGTTNTNPGDFNGFGDEEEM